MWPYLAAGAAIVAAIGGWQARDWKAGADERDRIQFERSRAEAARFNVDAASTRFEAKRADADARETRIAQEVRRATENLAAAGECLDADSLRILTDDAAASNARRELAPAVPAASAPG